MKIKITIIFCLPFFSSSSTVEDIKTKPLWPSHIFVILATKCLHIIISIWECCFKPSELWSVISMAKGVQANQWTLHWQYLWPHCHIWPILGHLHILGLVWLILGVCRIYSAVCWGWSRPSDAPNNGKNLTLDFVLFGSWCIVFLHITFFLLFVECRFLVFLLLILFHYIFTCLTLTLLRMSFKWEDLIVSVMIYWSTITQWTLPSFFEPWH